MRQSDVADVLGIVPSAYGSFERGSTYPLFKSLVQIVELFQVNLHDLVFTDLEKYPNGAPAPEPDEFTAMVITRLNRELDELSAQVIARADPDDLEELKALRADLIRRFPEQARRLGFKE